MKIKKNNGITLIALVITIIVMLILVAVTITIAVNGGIFKYAGKATRDTKTAKQEEQKIGLGYIQVDNKEYSSFDNYFAGKAEEVFSEIYTETEAYVENGVTTAWIPKGFAVGISEGINKVADGLVIQDRNGNQFVWIPTQASTDEEFEDLRIAITSFNEPLSSGAAQWELDEYSSMKSSVIEKGGFYIGRFEAGIPIAEEPRNYVLSGTDQNLGTNTVVVKRDCYPYNCVSWGNSMTDINNDISTTLYGPPTNVNLGKGAVFLSRNMYQADDDDYGAVSTLCYGVEWDAMLSFIGKINDSDYTSWGNFSTNTGDTWEITRQTAKYSDDYGATWKSISDEIDKKKTKTEEEAILLTTGANDNFKVKNIYDIAGNCNEWTMEACNTNNRTARGGCYRYEGVDEHGPFISFRGPINSTCYNDSFRPALFIKID